VSVEARAGEGAIERIIARSVAIQHSTSFEDDCSLLEVVFP